MIKSRGKENLIVYVDIREEVIRNEGDNVILDAEVFRYEDRSDIKDVLVSMHIDMYLDLLNDKNIADEEDEVYFSSNILENYDTIKDKVFITDGILCSFDYDNNHKIIKEVKND